MRSLTLFFILKSRIWLTHVWRRIVLMVSAVAMAVDAMPADGAVSVESTVSLSYASCNQSTANYKSSGDDRTQCQN